MNINTIVSKITELADESYWEHMKYFERHSRQAGLCAKRGNYGEARYHKGRRDELGIRSLAMRLLLGKLKSFVSEGQKSL